MVTRYACAVWAHEDYRAKPVSETGDCSIYLPVPTNRSYLSMSFQPETWPRWRVNTEVLRREWYAGFPARSDLFDTIPLFTELRNPATYKTYSVEYVVLAPFHPVSLLVSTFDRKWEPALSHFVDETMRCKVLRNLFIKVCVIPESMHRAQETTALQQSMIFKMVCLVA